MHNKLYTKFNDCAFSMLKFYKKRILISLYFAYSIEISLYLQRIIKKYVMKKLFVLLFAAAAVTACGDASDLAEAVENAVEEGTEAVEEAVEEGTEAVEEAVEEGTEAVEDAVEAPEAE